MMNIELISIGNELLTGFTVNSNAAYISQGLFLEGYTSSRHTVLPDDVNYLEKGIREALQRSDILIMTGGLGSTCDDNTRDIVAKIFNSDFHFDLAIAKDLKIRYGDSFPTIENQATVPSKAKIIKNLLGTAPGFIFEANSKIVILLPGVPHEMKAMFTDQVLLFLKNRFVGSLKNYSKRIHLVGLPEAAVDPLLRQLQKEYPVVEFGIYPSLGHLSVQLSVRDCEEEKAFSILSKPEKAVKAAFASYLFESATGRIEDSLQQLFIERKLTLSLAESCTGGSIASHLTQVPGSSQYFLGGVVAYSNVLKEKLLGVSSQLLVERGAVSQEVVEAMLQGILIKTGSDYGIAISGIAGPSGGTADKPVGTIWATIGRKGEHPHSWQFHSRGNRAVVIERCVNAVLGKLLLLVKG